MSATTSPLLRRPSERAWRIVCPILAVAGAAAAAAGPSWAETRTNSLGDEVSDHDSPLTRSSRAAPSVEALCRAAVALALAEPERARGFIARARAAGWLPEVRFRVFRRFARTEGLTLDDTSTTTPVDVSAVDDVRYEWRATWDLSRMVFNPDELQAHAEALRMSDVRRDIQSLVIRLYFERRRLLASGRGVTNREPEDKEGNVEGAAASPGAERRHLRVLEIEAQLEALSGIPLVPDGEGHDGASREGAPPREAAP